MGSQPLAQSSSTGDTAILTLYQQLLDAWNTRNAAQFAVLYTKDGSSIGFDGSQMNGSAQIAAEIGQIFRDHQTAAYIAKVREVRFLAPDVAILRAVVGMIPPGQKAINPAVNSIQTLVAVKQGDQWWIALFQNTPAQYHGRPELAQQLTEELQQLV